jgi:hypothetical protein
LRLGQVEELDRLAAERLDVGIGSLCGMGSGVLGRGPETR